MNFDERNQVWDGSRRLLVQANTRASAPRFWTIRCEGHVVKYTWGQLGGAVQEADETCQGVNIGKKNEISPTDYALYRAKEMIRKKMWEGYREAADRPGHAVIEYLDPPAETGINFDSLALSLSFYKPDNTMGAGITKKAREGKCWYARKRNGLMYVICKGSDIPHLYSRKMLRQHDDEEGQPFTWDDRFPHIIQAADAVMPENSILLGELVLDVAGKDDFQAVQSFTKSLTPQSLLDQMQRGRPSFYIWDIAFWNGQDLVSKAPVSTRYELIHEIGNEILIPVEYYDCETLPSPEHATEYAKLLGWEGFVVVDPEGIYGDKAYNFKGKPDRPGTVCAKLKPNYEDDFVVLWNPDNKVSDPPLSAISYDKRATVGGRSKKGRYEGGIESVALFQYNSQGQLVYISNVSSGLTEEMRRDWAKPELFPQVWKVEYKGRRFTSQGDDTNALDFAAFLEVRRDKTVEECINPEL